MTDVDPYLALRSVTRVHGHGAAEVHALRGVDLDIYPGELVAVMGPSGSGKSTLLNLAGGLDTPTSGVVTVGGVPISELDANGRAQLRRQAVGYVFQDLNLIPALTAIENVMLPLELDGVPTKTARAQALTALAEVEMDGLAGRFPDEMSGGQAQRVAIARAQVNGANLLFADEPTGSLDSKTGADVLEILLTSTTQAGKSLVMVTHDAEVASQCDRIITLQDGAIVGNRRYRHFVPQQLLGFG